MLDRRGSRSWIRTNDSFRCVINSHVAYRSPILEYSIVKEIRELGTIQHCAVQSGMSYLLDDLGMVVDLARVELAIF